MSRRGDAHTEKGDAKTGKADAPTVYWTNNSTTIETYTTVRTVRETINIKLPVKQSSPSSNKMITGNMPPRPSGTRPERGYANNGSRPDQRQQGYRSGSQPDANIQNSSQPGQFNQPRYQPVEYRNGPQPGGYQQGNQQGIQQGEYRNGPQPGGYQQGNQQGEYRNGPQPGGYQQGNQQGEYSNGPQPGGYQQGNQQGFQQCEYHNGPQPGSFQQGEYSNGPQPGGYQQGEYSNGPQPGGYQQGEYSNGPQPGGYQQGEYSNGPQPGGYQQGNQQGLHQGEYHNGPQPGDYQQGEYSNGPQPGGYQQGEYSNGPQPGGYQQGAYSNGPQPGGYQQGNQQGFHQGEYHNGPQPGGYQQGEYSNCPQPGGYQQGEYSNGPQPGGYQQGNQQGFHQGEYRNGPQPGEYQPIFQHCQYMNQYINPEQNLQLGYSVAGENQIVLYIPTDTRMDNVEDVTEVTENMMNHSLREAEDHSVTVPRSPLAICSAEMLPSSGGTPTTTDGQELMETSAAASVADTDHNSPPGDDTGTGSSSHVEIPCDTSGTNEVGRTSSEIKKDRIERYRLRQIEMIKRAKELTDKVIEQFRQEEKVSSGAWLRGACNRRVDGWTDYRVST